MGAYAPSRHFCPEMWLPIFFFDLFRKVSTEARCWGSPPPNGNGWRLCEGWEYIDSFNSNLRLLINPMEWFPPPFSLQDGMHEWSKVPDRPHERGKGLLEPSTLTTKLDVVWRVREEMIEGPQADTGGGKELPRDPKWLRNLCKVTRRWHHTWWMWPRRRRTPSRSRLRSSQIEHSNTRKWPKKQEYPSNILSR